MLRSIYVFHVSASSIINKRIPLVLLCLYHLYDSSKSRAKSDQVRQVFLCLEIRSHVLRGARSALYVAESLADELLRLLLFLNLLLLEGCDSILVRLTVLHVLLLRIDQGLRLLFVLVAAADVCFDTQLRG